MTQTFGPRDLGCYVDGVRGIYAGTAIIELAECYGWYCDPSADRNPYDGEGYDENVDDAVDYLNTLCTPEVYFGWTDGGDFCLLPRDYLYAL